MVSELPSKVTQNYNIVTEEAFITYDDKNRFYIFQLTINCSQ